jgi:hypothetical protein
METRKEINKVSSIVEELLRKDERCRNDDKWLTYLVMRRFTKIFIPFEDFNKLPAFETVKRTRAKIQNVDKKYLPTDPEVIKKRQIREQIFKKEFSQAVLLK